MGKHVMFGNINNIKITITMQREIAEIFSLYCFTLSYNKVRI
jgi:hypothetical protein